MQAFDVAINGGGMIGLTLACGLQKSGLRVAVIERQDLERKFFDDYAGLQVYAINAASRQLLKYVNVWDTVAARGASPYRVIEVWERDSFGRITFDGAEIGCLALGHIVENIAIQQTLWQRVKELSEKIVLLTPTSLYQVDWKENEALITLENNRVLTAKLVVAADGAHSWLRTHADIPLTFWDYRHHALVATVRTVKPHGNIARQTFHGNGILAFLPLKDPHLSSIVWSLPPVTANEYLAASVETFNAVLAINFNLVLGLCELQGKRKIFPITGRYARNFVGHRLVLIGDAAHTIHPLAGQGANLGFMDVAMLLEEIWRLQKLGKDIGHYQNLRRYEHNRKRSAVLMLAGMQGLYELFYGQHSLKKWFRNAGLRLVDMLPSIKSRFIQQAIGLRDLPSWLVNNSFD